MRLRVVRCGADGWVGADGCPHWPRKCEAGGKHRLTRGTAGYAVAVTGIPYDGWEYDYPPPPYALELTAKRFAGGWYPGPHGSDGTWRAAPMGNLVTCRRCELTGAL